MRTKRIKAKIRRIAFFTLIIFLFDIAPIPYWIPWAPAELYMYIGGKVTDAQTGEPVANLDVIAVRSGDTSGETFSAKTTAQGNYALCCAPPGMYQLVIDPQSPYIREYPHKEVTVVRGRNVINANFLVQKGSRFSGVIHDWDGTTPINLGVTLADQISEGNEQDLTYFIPIGDGRFTLSGLKPGKTYRVYAKTTNRASVYKDIQMPLPGQVVENLNFTLGKPGTKILGTVSSSTGEKIKDAEVRVMSNKVSGYATTDEQGQYVISGLVEGEYVFTAIASNYEPFGQFRIQIQTNQERIENISLKPSATTTGNVQPNHTQKRIDINPVLPSRISPAYTVTPAFAFWGNVFIQSKRLEAGVVAINTGNILAQKINVLDLANQIRAAFIDAGIYTVAAVTVVEIAEIICKATSKEGDWVVSKPQTAKRPPERDICEILNQTCRTACELLYRDNEIISTRCTLACTKDRDFCRANNGRWPSPPESQSFKFLYGFGEE